MDWRGGSRKRRIVIAVAAAALIFGIAFVDLATTTARVPEVPAACDPPIDTICNEQRNDEFSERLDEAIELSDGFDLRAGIYAAALILVGFWLAAAGVAGRPRPQWRQTFRDLGTGTVAFLAIGGGLTLAVNGGLIDFPARIVIAPVVVLLALAAIGTMMSGTADEATPAEAEAEAGRPGSLRAALGRREASGIGFALVAATLALVVVGVDAAGDPCVVAESGTSDGLFTAGLIAAAAAMVVGAALLVVQRWVAALVCLVLPPVFVVYGALVSFCWNEEPARADWGAPSAGLPAARSSPSFPRQARNRPPSFPLRPRFAPRTRRGRCGRRPAPPAGSRG